MVIGSIHIMQPLLLKHLHMHLMTASAEACSRIWFVEFELDAVFAEATDISPIYIELVCLNLTQRQSVIPVLTHVPLRILR